MPRSANVCPRNRVRYTVYQPQEILMGSLSASACSARMPRLPHEAEEERGDTENRRACNEAR